MGIDQESRQKATECLFMRGLKSDPDCVDYNSTRSALRLRFLEGRRPLSRSLDIIYFQVNML